MRYSVIVFFSLNTFLSFFTFAADFGLPIISDISQFYYVPQIKLEIDKKSFLSSKSYSNSNNIYIENWSFFSGYRQCRFENIHLVNKKSKESKKLFEIDMDINSYFVTSDSQNKKSFPLLMFVKAKLKEASSSKGDFESDSFAFYIAKIDGSNLKKVTPEGLHVISYEFDISNKKLILLLRKEKGSSEKNNPSAPYIVDLTKVDLATPLIN